MPKVAPNDMIQSLTQEEEVDSFARLVRMTGGDSAKSAYSTCLSTLAVVDGLMLSFVVPNLSNPPATLTSDPQFDNAFRAWFWLSLWSVLTSICSLIFATVLLTSLSYVPPSGMVKFIIGSRIHYKVTATTFVFSVLLQGGAELCNIYSFLEQPHNSDFWAAVACLIVVYISILAMFARMDPWANNLNDEEYRQWLKDEEKRRFVEQD